GEFLIRINNRKVLTGFFSSLGVSADQIKTCINIIDTLEKVGVAKVLAALATQELSSEQAQQVIDFINIKGNVDQVLIALNEFAVKLPNSEQFKLGIEELNTVINGVRDLGVPECQYCIDLSIARGLDYYTGTVYETTLIGHEALGSICSGGRYEELVGTFIGESMPGVGISIGLTRLIYRLLKANILQPLAPTPTQVMVLNLQSDLMPIYLQVSQQLRQSGIKVATAFDKRPLKKQFALADKQGVIFCVIIGEEEANNQQCILKNMISGEQVMLSINNLATEIKQRLG
ncbi:MAG: histidine--tRNA ligase family protein, partial [Chamaesiphon sp.]|nr:histidine--tRNA ligase family protein [Chamaesiphon sp.]